MGKYAWMYRLGIRPWERADGIAGEVPDHLDRERAGREPPLGRALDVGCGRGQYTPELARRGWEAVGVDAVPQAVGAARRTAPPDVTYVVGDVTALDPLVLGTFDLFLDVGVIQGLPAAARMATGRSLTALARPGATLLVLAFGRTRLRWLAEGVSQPELVAAFPGWSLATVEDAGTGGLGWPMNRTSPRWYRFRLNGPSPEPTS